MKEMEILVRAAGIELKYKYLISLNLNNFIFPIDTHFDTHFDTQMVREII